jgi:hypothetical protein
MSTLISARVWIKFATKLMGYSDIRASDMRNPTNQIEPRTWERLVQPHSPMDTQSHFSKWESDLCRLIGNEFTRV